jgi:hypothetical protein
MGSSAHPRGGGGGGVWLQSWRGGSSLARYDTRAWTIGHGGGILSDGRGKVAWGEGINEGGAAVASHVVQSSGRE